jgi:hypothetical protein
VNPFSVQSLAWNPEFVGSLLIFEGVCFGVIHDTELSHRFIDRRNAKGPNNTAKIRRIMRT